MTTTRSTYFLRVAQVPFKQSLMEFVLPERTQPRSFCGSMARLALAGMLNSISMMLQTIPTIRRSLVLRPQRLYSETSQRQIVCLLLLRTQETVVADLELVQ